MAERLLRESDVIKALMEHPYTLLTKREARKAVENTPTYGYEPETTQPPEENEIK